MKIGLSVFNITTNIKTNKVKIINDVQQAAQYGADLIVFPETCITGLINEGDPDEDFTYALSRKDNYWQELFILAERLSISISIGFLEKTKENLYDSLIFYDHIKEEQYLYRRIDSGWKSRNSNLNIYKEGKNIKIIDTSIGRFALLICGDLFNEDVIRELRKEDFDYLIHPLVCHDKFNGEKVTPEFWKKEFKYYIDQYKLLNSTSFVVNLLGKDLRGNNAFGGAWIISPQGELVAEKDIYESGILYYEM